MRTFIYSKARYAKLCILARVRRRRRRRDAARHCILIVEGTSFQKRFFFPPRLIDSKFQVCESFLARFQEFLDANRQRID